MRRKIVPLLLLISLAANLFLGVQLYQEGRHVNWITWQYGVNQLWKHVHWAEGSITPGPDGRVFGQDLGSVSLALEDLEGLQSLPYYGKRTESAEMGTIQQFLRYAQRAYGVAAQEQGETGRVSPESARRLAKIREGLALVLSGNSRTNELTQSAYPWNHAAWRAMWREIADGLRQMDFVPLAE